MVLNVQWDIQRYEDEAQALAASSIEYNGTAQALMVSNIQRYERDAQALAVSNIE